MENEDIKKLLEKNLELNKKIYDVVLKVKSYLLWQRVFGILKILIFVVPIVIGIIYLPPLLKNIFAEYKEILNIQSGLSSVTSELDINNILQQINSVKK